MVLSAEHPYPTPFGVHEVGDAGSLIGQFALIILQAVGLAYWLGTLSARVSATAARVVYLETHGSEALREASVELREAVRRMDVLEAKIDRLLDKHLRMA
jgi:hypothetical protein